MPPPLPPFVFPNLPATWFIGHMSRALREMQLMIQKQQVDLIIECRDARLPLTSINPAFESILHSAGKGAGITKRLIVYNKADLAQDCFHEPLKNALKKHGDEEVLFTDSTSDAEVRKLLKAAIRVANRPLDEEGDRITMVVAGMPNVGKSSILNALRRVGVRKGKAASTSSMPGHTRAISNVIKIWESPPVYINDSPGIMVPYLGRGVKGNETALKLALTGGIKESLFEGDTVCEYLLWRLRSRVLAGEDGYNEAELFKSLSLPPTTPLDDPTAFFEALARRLSAVRKGGELDTDFAGKWLIHAFREGKLGRWTLDGLGRGGETADVEVALDEAELDARRLFPKVVQPVEKVETTEEGKKAAIEAMVDDAVTDYMDHQSRPSLSMTSGHQAKKQQKAAQAQVREVKKLSKAVAKVQGPGGGISSARRRKYRRG
ncbi:mitochondrial GTPase [Pseudohyphozyma bogoriensis]|nr:mitochondrial GTPase [Pseudohyphozyma bogoriensis]